MVSTTIRHKKKNTLEVLLERERVSVLLCTVSVVVFLASDTSLCVLGDFLFEEVGLREEAKKEKGKKRKRKRNRERKKLKKENI